MKLDGNAEKHDFQRMLINGGSTFNRIFANICRLINTYHEKIKVFIRVNTSSNFSVPDLEFLSSLPDTAKECAYIDIEAIHNNPDNDQSFNKNAFSELSRRIFTLRKRVKEMGLDVNHWFYSNRLFGCQAEMPNSYTILPDGNFIICTGLDTIDKFTIGYLNTNGKLEKVNLIKERWNADNPLSIEECKNCKLFPICLGGCTFARIEKQRPSCLIEKYQINDYLRLLI